MAGDWEGNVSRPRRLLLPAVLLAAGLLIGVVAPTSDPRQEFSVIPGDPRPPPLPAVGAQPDHGGTWATIGGGPLDARLDPATVWSGREVVVWGGLGRGGAGLRDGAAYSVESGTWRSLPPAPVDGRRRAAVVWSGREMLVWGGETPDGVRRDGVAFNPRSNRWRLLPPAPLQGRRGAEAVWTGTELVIWGGDSESRPFTDGARYNPATDSWRRLPAGPLAGRADLDVSMSALDGGVLVWSSDGREAAALFYDLATDRWRPLWTPRLHPATDPVFAAMDGAVLAWGAATTDSRQPHAMKFTTRPDWWTTVATPPEAPRGNRPLLASDGVAVAWSRGGPGVWFDALAGRWYRMAPPPQPVVAAQPEQVWTGDRLVVWHAHVPPGTRGRAIVWRPPTGWERLAGAPLPIGDGMSAVWTGWLGDRQQALLWGGADANGAGAGYDPALGLWEALPASPLPGRVDHVALWLESEMLVLGGRDERHQQSRRDGAVYDPGDRTWRSIAPAPVHVTAGAAAWNGRHVYAAGIHDGRIRLARYDGRDDRWTVAPRPPLPAVDGGSVSVWWTGAEVWVVSSGRRSAGAGAAWHPDSRTWRRLPPHPGLRQAVSMAVGWRRLFVMGADGSSASLGLGTLEWRAHPRGPRLSRPPALVWVGGNVVAYDPQGRRLAVLTARSAAWAEPAPPPLPRADTAEVLWNGRHLMVFAGGEAVMLTP